MKTRPAQVSPATLKPSAQRAFTEAIFDSIGDGAIATDEFGKITRVNPVASQILGYQESELVGEWFPKMIVAYTADNKPLNLIDCSITKAFLTGRPISEKAYYHRKNGEIFPVAINVSPIVLHGRPLGAIEVFRDITFEAEIDRMKSEFISLASHQLRTPLSTIKTYSHMLIDGYVGETTAEQKKSLRTIITATNRMNSLISTLLNITRIESGTISVAYKTVAIDKIAREVLDELTLMAANYNINLSLELYGKTNIRFRTDVLIFKEILTNLISNSIKYTPEGGAVVVAIKPRPDDILLSVSDTGWGIPKNVQGQIFSKFFRAHNIVKRETTGTGLGLYLVKSLLEQLGGKIWFTSKIGRGTTFYFILPLPTKRQKSSHLKAEASK